MEMLKLLIADASEEFRLALADLLRGEYVIRLCQEGKETLETLRNFKPDFLVLDLMLPGLDGISLLQQMMDAGMHPMVLATTRLVNDYVQESAERMGVGYLMVKPCDLKATADRILDMTRHMKGPAVTQPDPMTMVSNLLLSLGLQAKLRGYAYLRDAILETIQRPGQLVTKELYPTVGKPYQANQVQVERSIRSAIEKAWKNRDDQLWRRYFRTEPDGQLAKPTNAEFISCIAERVRRGE